MWGWFIGIFVGIWLLQIYLTSIQMKHYQKTLKEMSRRESGYLGVGVLKQKLGIGTVVILVSDLQGLIIDCKVMTGVTVFTRFKDFIQYNGMSLEQCERMLASDDPFASTVRMAIANINQQREKAQQIV